SSRFLMRSLREPVLVLARDGPLLGHHLAVLAHALAGARLGHAREARLELAQRESFRRGRQALAECLRAREREHALLQLLAVDDRHVGGRVGAAADTGCDLTG